MATLVAEIPAYVEGRNPKCIDVVLKTISALLGLHINLDDLLELSDELERNLMTCRGTARASELIKKLNRIMITKFRYRNGDLKLWLQQHGIELD